MRKLLENLIRYPVYSNLLMIMLLVLGIGPGAWFLLRDEGLVEQVSEARIEQALSANGVPTGMSECMAQRLVDRLSLAQLRKLERIAPHEGAGALPTSLTEALARLRRVDDEEATEQVVLTVTRCGAEALLEGL